MKYSMLYDEFLTHFPEDIIVLKDKADKLTIAPSDGMHVVFGMIVMPFIIKLIVKKNEKKLKIAFNSFEQMATSEEPLICEVLEFTVLETLISQEKNTLNYCKSYMKKETLKSCLAVEQYMM